MGPASNHFRRVDYRNRSYMPGSNCNGTGIRMSGQQNKKKDTSVSFHAAAREYIEKLIRLQRNVPPQYKRIDQSAVHESINKLETLLSFYAYNEDSKMIRFWRKYRYHIRILIPTNRHPAFTKLLMEFELLDSYTEADKENLIWHTVASALGKF